MYDAGTVIGGDYRIERLLGRGRFAEVYAARHLHADRVVALKVFRPELTSKAGGGKRFLRKSRVATDQPHPAVVHIEDRGMTDQGAPYVAMELLRGRTVGAEVEARGPLAVDRSLHIIEIVLQALAAIHRDGHTHRNVNPANVFLVDGEAGPPVRLLDFGVVHELVDHLAVSPDVVGSTSFLAPEFILSPTKVWTPAVDVFAAGMVLYVMLAGRLPFTKEDHDLGSALDAKTIGLYQSVDALPGPAVFSPHLPASIDAVVRKAISVDPEGRYHDAGALLDALAEARARIPAAALAASSDPSPGRGRLSAPSMPASSPSMVPPQLGGQGDRLPRPTPSLDPLDAPTERVTVDHARALRAMMGAASSPSPLSALDAPTAMKTPEQLAALELPDLGRRRLPDPLDAPTFQNGPSDLVSPTQPIETLREGWSDLHEPPQPIETIEGGLGSPVTERLPETGEEAGLGSPVTQILPEDDLPERAAPELGRVDEVATLFLDGGSAPMPAAPEPSGALDAPTLTFDRSSRLPVQPMVPARQRRGGCPTALVVLAVVAVVAVVALLLLVMAFLMAWG